jgi:RNA polymerase sigma factor (sigma-70 family)
MNDMKKYYSRIYQYARSLTLDRDNALDLTQDTFVKAIRYADKFQEGTNYEAWLTRICKNTFYNDYRAKLIRPSSTFSSLDTEVRQFSETINGGSFSIDEPFSDNILEAISYLPATQQRVVHLHFVEGKEYSEIAVLCDTNVNTVKTWVHRAMKFMRNNTVRFGLVRMAA